MKKSCSRISPGIAEIFVVMAEILVSIWSMRDSSVRIVLETSTSEICVNKKDANKSSGINTKIRCEAKNLVLSFAFSLKYVRKRLFFVISLLPALYIP